MKKLTAMVLLCNETMLDDALLYSLLSSDRKEKISQLRFADKKMTSMGAELMLRYAVKAAGLPGADPLYHRTETGKPVLNICGYHANLSHSDRYAACLLSDIEVGLDIEKHRTVSANITSAVLSPDEAGTPLTPDGILEKWTVKESYFKLTGQGITHLSMHKVSAKDGRILSGTDTAAYYSTLYLPEHSLYVSCSAYQPIELSAEIYTLDDIRSRLPG